MAYFTPTDAYEEYVNIKEDSDNILKVDCTLEQHLLHEGLMFHTLPELLQSPLNDEVNLKITLDEFFTNLYSKFKSAGNLAIDGPSAMAKSSMLNDSFTQKVNNFININQNNCYNNNPIAALSYYTISAEMYKCFNKTLFDRSPISNLAYGLCFYIMNILTKDQIGYRTLTGICEEFIKNLNLTSFLEYINAQEFNILIMIDSSYPHYAKRLNKRGYNTNSRSDINKSMVYEYWVGQTAAFSYLANALNLNCIDINKIRMVYPKLDDVIIFDTLCKSFKVNCSSKIESVINSATINPQVTSMADDSIRNLIMDIFKISKR